MNKRFFTVLSVALVISSLAFFGCKSKVDKAAEMQRQELSEGMTAAQDILGPETAVQEPAQNLATETIPPTASPEIAPKQVMVSQDQQDRNKDIQKALKSAGFYTGAIDGKIGPKTKEAIKAFQKSQGLVVDGRVGPKTWAELGKYLAQ